VVEVTTLDGIAEALSLDRVDFIKIDVEGFEQSVLDGGETVIERDRPVMLIEIADRVEGSSFRNPSYAETLTWLEEHGYTTYRCRPDGRLERGDPEKPQSHLAMYLCLHRAAHQGWLRKVHSWARLYRRRIWAHRARRVVRLLR
jgi:hypothetical protein